MTLSDRAIERLRFAADLPDLTGTRYRSAVKLGQGGMGGVYRVEDSVLGRNVAMKVVSVPDQAGQLAMRLMREAKIIAQLEHPGIVPVHDVGTLPDDRVFYTMKLVQGQSLDQHLSPSGTLQQSLRILQKVCDSVSFAHAHGVLHRDLKPQNIMVGPFGEVLVMDWGLSKILQDHADQSSPTAATPSGPPSDASATSHGAVLGTPGYMAPEQARGEIEHLDKRADVFSLGAILRFLISASAAHGPEVPRRRALNAIVAKATAADPSERYASVDVLASDITAYLDDLPVLAYPEGPFAWLWRWIVRNRAWLLLVLAYLAMRAFFIVWRGR